MKKKLLSLVLTLILCLQLIVPAFAFVDFEDALSYGAWTWSARLYYPLDGINSDMEQTKFEQGTGLTVFHESVPDAIFGEFVYHGLKDSRGNIVFPAEFSEFSYLGDDRIVAWNTRNGLASNHSGWGIYTLSGGVIYPPKALTIQYADKNKQDFLIEVSTGRSTSSQEERAYLGSVSGIYDWNGKELLAPKYAIIDYMEDGYYRLQEGHQNNDGSFYWSYGVYKYGAGVIIPCQKDMGISYLAKDMFRIRPSAFCYGVIDGNGKQILPCIYAGIHSYADGYFAVAIPRSEQYRQRAIKENAPTESYDSLHNSGDISDAEGYLTMGIVDASGNVYSSFDHDLAYIGNDGKAYLKKWNGGHEKYYPYPNVQGWNKLYYDVKSYDTEAISLLSPTSTGKAITNILRERGIATTDTTITTTPVVSTIGGFTDVKSSDYYADAVLWAVEKNITSGTSATTFSPNSTCSKAQILTFLWRANGSPEPTAAKTFTDIKTSDYFYKAALWAAEKGLVSGSTFGANTDCTRAMTVEYLWKAAGSPAPSGKSSFTDVPADADYASAVAWAVEQKITSGTGGGKFSPATTCTRGQIVTFLHRAMG